MDFRRGRAFSGYIFLLLMVGGAIMVGGFLVAFSAGSAVAEAGVSAHTHEALLAAQDVDSLPACETAEDMRLFEPAPPATPQPAQPAGTPDPNAPAPTPTPIPPTPRPAPSEDRVGFPENYREMYKLLFVFDRPDNRSVRIICGNDLAASRQPGEPFPYGSILIMESWAAKIGEDGMPVLDENGHYIRERLGGIFVQRKEEGFGEAYLEDRSGEWEYVAYRQDGSTLIPPARTNNCAACHLQQAGESVDFVFRMDLFYEPESAFVPPETADNEVNIFLYQFMPAPLTVKAGTTVNWINNDESEHVISSVDGLFGSGNLKTKNITPGDSFSFTFDTPGTYEYNCSIHPRMTGTIIVTE